MVPRRVYQPWLLVSVVTCVITLLHSGELPAQVQPLAQVAAFRVELDGIEPFLCEAIRNVGVDIEKVPNRKPLPFRAKIRDVRITKPFTKHRELHAWMHQAKNGQAELKSGVIYFIDAGGNTALRINFVGAWLKSWTMEIPEIGEKGLIKEHITLTIRDFELIYE